MFQPSLFVDARARPWMLAQLGYQLGYLSIPARRLLRGVASRTNASKDKNAGEVADSDAREETDGDAT